MLSAAHDILQSKFGEQVSSHLILDYLSHEESWKLPFKSGRTRGEKTDFKIVLHQIIFLLIRTILSYKLELIIN